MIREDELMAIGRVTKTHGIQGELNIALDYELDPGSLRCLIFEIDGIFVPFFPESVRPRGSESALVRLEGIDSDEAAAQFVKHTVYALAEELPDELETYADEVDGYDMEELTGFILKDTNTGFKGEITDYDISTENALILVTAEDGMEHTLPFSGDLVEDYDEENRVITMHIPEGLLEI